MRASSHILDRLQVTFDHEHAVADAGLLLPATLAGHLGLRELFDTYVDLGDAPGRANVGHKAMTLIASILAGGDCFDDAAALAAGRTERVLGHQLRAPSTLGTFARSFTWGHVRQTDRVSRRLLARGWQAGAAPEGPLTLDLDSTICETYGLAKQGANFGHTKVRGYHPLLAVIAGAGDVVHGRLRGGNASDARDAAGFLTESLARIREAGGTVALVRGDAGFFSQKLLDVCTANKANFSIAIKQNPRVKRAIDAIDDDAWTPIPYWIDGGADVAEIPFYPTNDATTPARLIVRRVRPTPGSQLALLVDYHTIITDRPGNLLEVEADHRRHAEIENAIRDLKHGLGLNRMPSGDFAANGLWLALNIIAHNLLRWTARLGLREQLLITAKTLRRRFLALPGRITRRHRREHLHLPARWPWAEQFHDALARLRAIPAPT